MISWQTDEEYYSSKTKNASKYGGLKEGGGTKSVCSVDPSRTAK